MQTILILEDEPALAKMVCRMLAPYRVLDAANAEQAVQQFRTHRDVDLLIADVVLPDMSGIQVALLLRAENPDLAVILASGYPPGNWAPEEMADLARLGPKSVAVLQKPFPSATLRRTVTQLIGAPALAAPAARLAIVPPD